MRELLVCPWSEITAEAYEMFTWWSEFKSLGILPYGGRDLMDQPGFVYEAISLVQRISDEVSADNTRRHQSEVQKQIDRLKDDRKRR